MSLVKKQNKTFAWVLAASIEMIEESHYHAQTFAHTLAVHHNQQAADIFERLACYFSQEQERVLEAIKGIELPKIPPWEIPFQDFSHPVSALFEADYLINEQKTWSIVNELVQIHTCFYTHLIETHQAEEVIEFAKRQLQFCLKCKQQNLEKQRHCDANQRQDFDPPVAQS